MVIGAVEALPGYDSGRIVSLCIRLLQSSGHRACLAGADELAQNLSHPIAAASEVNAAQVEYQKIA
jgi:hypothetical protein